MSAYLFVHFIGEQEDGEQIHFAISKDGLHWKDLNNSKPVLYSHVGELGVRDPFIVRHPKTEKFYLIATDLRIASKKGWDAAIRSGSRSIIVWESEDLVHWSEERSCRIGVENAGCVWAPEAIFDEEKDAFQVFFTSKIWESEETGKHKIFASYTNDFKEFSEPFVFLEKGCDVIDSTIIKNGDTYYRFTKDETESKVILEASKQLTGSYRKINSELLRKLDGVEGPECYLLPDRKTWCLIVDQFARKLGYKPFLITDLDKGKFTSLAESEYDFGASKKRHGGIIEITDEEYEKLQAFKWHTFNKEITYKKAAKEDALEQLKLQREAFLSLFKKYQDEESPANMSLNEIEGRIENPNGCYYVIRAEEKTIGGIYAYPWNESMEEMYLCSIYISPSMQGNGIAQKAIQFIQGKHPKVKRWVLEVPEKEEKNIHIYEKMGYKATSKTQKINERLTLVTYIKE